MGRGEEGRRGFVWGIPSERAGWDPASPHWAPSNGAQLSPSPRCWISV